MQVMPRLLPRLCAAVMASLSLTLAACSWILPADPYLQAKNVPPLAVPESLDSPSPDPNLAVPTGEIAAKPIKGGHMPPNDAIGKPSE